MIRIDYYTPGTTTVAGSIRDEGGHLENVELYREADLTGQTLPVDTLTFSVNDKTGLPPLEKGQTVALYMGINCHALMYIIKIEKVSSYTINVSCYSAIGKMEEEMFDGGMYTDWSVDNLVSEIFKGYWHSSSVPSTDTFTGWIPYCNKREALQQIMQADGLEVDIVSGRPNIVTKCSNTVSAYDIKSGSHRANITASPTIVENDYITTPRVTCKTVPLDVTTEYEEVWRGYASYLEPYDGVANGYKICFDKPHQIYEIVGKDGAAVSGVTEYIHSNNYIIITATSINKFFIINGKKYSEGEAINYDMNASGGVKKHPESAKFVHDNSYLDLGSQYVWNTSYNWYALSKAHDAMRLNHTITVEFIGALGQSEIVYPYSGLYLFLKNGKTITGKITKVTATYGHNIVLYSVEAITDDTSIY